jgi:hypothetical protein
MRTKRREPEKWTSGTWAKVYGFQKEVGEGWAGRKDGLFLGKFKGEVDPKEGLHPPTAGMQESGGCWSS